MSETEWWMDDEGEDSHDVDLKIGFDWSDFWTAVLTLVVCAALLAIFIVTVVGCGPSETQEQKVETSVRAYSHEILAGDYNKAFDMRTTRCQEHSGRKLITEAWKSIRESWTGSKQPIVIQVDVYEDRATVNYTFEDPKWNQEGEAWALTRDGWRNDEC